MQCLCSVEQELLLERKESEVGLNVSQNLIVVSQSSAQMQAVAHLQPAVRCAPLVQASCCGGSDARFFTGQAVACKHQRQSCTQRHSHMNTTLQQSSWQGLQSALLLYLSVLQWQAWHDRTGTVSSAILQVAQANGGSSQPVQLR